MKVIKRNGDVVDFNVEKIKAAIEKANTEVVDKIPTEEEDRRSREVLLRDEINSIASNVVNQCALECNRTGKPITVEQIQDMVETALMKAKAYETAKAYIRYRYCHEVARDKYNEFMDALSAKIEATDVQNQNANVDEVSFGGRAGEAKNLMMKQYALDFCMSDMSKQNHLNNEIYIHDLDNYAVGNHNCLSVPFDKLLANGFNTRQTDVRPANSLNTAMQLVAVIFQIQSLQQFGGVSATHFDWTMVPYVRKSFYKHFKDAFTWGIGGHSASDFIDLPKEKITETSIEDEFYTRFPNERKYALAQTEKECHQSIEALYHNLNTLQSRSGNQLKLWLAI